jgi:exopolysaccharide biosynthesis predicted pyruvyltransferase EpsI
MSDCTMLFALKSTIDATLLPLLRGARRVALIDFPNHANVGDSMIWLGQYEFLRSHGIEIVYVASPADYTEAGLRRCLGPHDAILIQGGGNLGDLWHPEQALRESVISQFHSHRVIQLPQSVMFQHAQNRERAREIFTSHPNLTLITRDTISQQKAGKELGCEAHLCPDMALYLPALSRLPETFDGVVWLGRTDKEGLPETDEIPRDSRILVCDWAYDAKMPSQRWLRRARGFDKRLSLNGRPIFARKAFYRLLAEKRLNRGIEIVSRGKVLITERLHGHILATLLGLPHVVLDNSYGKTRAFHEAWTKESRLTHFARSRQDAVSQALRLQNIQSQMAIRRG